MCLGVLESFIFLGDKFPPKATELRGATERGRERERQRQGERMMKKAVALLALFGAVCTADGMQPGPSVRVCLALPRGASRTHTHTHTHTHSRARSLALAL